MAVKKPSLGGVPAKSSAGLPALRRGSSLPSRARLMETSLREADDAIRVRGFGVAGRAALIVAVGVALALVVLAATGRFPW